MTSKRLSIRIGPKLEEHLRRRAKSSGRDASSIVREALEEYLSRTRPPASAYDLAKEAGLIGCVRDAPADLSTNRKYSEGFGESQ